MVVLVLMDSKNRVLYCGAVTGERKCKNTVPCCGRKVITLAATYNAAESYYSALIIQAE
ncbi:MAG: hypothetical protein ACLTE2_03780 [Eubacteriales bacterium]